MNTYLILKVLECLIHGEEICDKYTITKVSLVTMKDSAPLRADPIGPLYTSMPIETRHQEVLACPC